MQWCVATSCGWYRWQLFQDGARHLTIRYNPDAYDGRELTDEYRLEELIKAINTWITCPLEDIEPNGANVIFMFYSRRGHKHIAAALNNPDSVNVLQVVS